MAKVKDSLNRKCGMGYIEGVLHDQAQLCKAFRHSAHKTHDLGAYDSLNVVADEMSGAVKEPSIGY